MPWNGITIVDLRKEFVHLALAENANIAELSRDYKISRPTAYKWINRFCSEGEKGLFDQKRTPYNNPNKTTNKIESLILKSREKHPGWGGRKLRKWLLNKGHQDIPAVSTITEILRRNGYLNCIDDKQHNWQRFEHPEPNRLWQMDFKGHFAMEKGRCHPLTILDDHSRFSIGLRACSDEQKLTVQEHLIEIFKCYGLPAKMNVDNGPPWGFTGPATRFTRLSVWLISLGIHVGFSKPMHPQTNGKIERFHKSLKNELLKHIYMHDLSHAQKLFDKWRAEYNLERPHEAIDMNVPADLYKHSHRKYDANQPPFEYAAADNVRKVVYRGYIKYKGNTLYIGEGFRGKYIAIRPSINDGLIDIYFCHQKIKQFDFKNLNE